MTSQVEIISTNMFFGGDYFLGLKKPNHVQREPSTLDLKSNIVQGSNIHPLGLIAAAPLVALPSDLTADEQKKAGTVA
uniref:Uncharacterized protein n=1 Tax=Oryza sativa subsp. japonica TaxID=39947 RepID=Q6H458_ORYSJ|nr:hypothetical protein [Oryza sativa Japonica Group]BAD26491.1 hypothetical protein [Oryza sativa Japonica Group]